MSNLSTLERIRLTIARRNPRVQDNFADFDRLRSGCVTKEQFRRCLTVANLTDGLSEQEIVALINNYENPSNPILSSYTRFLADLKEGDAPAEQLSPTRGTVKQLTDEEEATIERSNAFFRQRIAAAGLDLRSMFKDFDKRRNNGVITASQFERCFPFKVDPAVMSAIKKKYAFGESGDISYACWCADVLGEPLGDGTIRFRGTATNGFNGSSSGARDGASLIEQIRHQLFTNRLRCEDFLRDYDKLNTGVVTPTQFAAAMGRVHFVRFQLTAADMNTLSEYYAVEDKSGQLKVNYSAFLQDVAPHIQPVATAGLHQTFGTRFDAEDEKRCDAVVEKIRNAIATRRMNLRPTFHDFDQAQNGIYRTRTCTRTRFERALAINKVDVTPAEVSLLVRRYNTTTCNAGNDINYNAFCDDVDQMPTGEEATSNINNRSLLGNSGNAVAGSGMNAAKSRGSSNANSPMKSFSTAAAYPSAFGGAGAGFGTNINGADDAAIADILDKVMKVVINRRVRLSEFIRDNDPLRTGAVPKDRFLSALTTSGVVLSTDELGALAAHYAHPTVPNFIDTNHFLADVDTGAHIIHPAEQPQDREIEVKQRTLNATMSKKDATVASNGPQLAMVLKRIAEDVRARGVLLPPFFKDYDLRKCGRITKVQFHQTLSRHKFPASEADIDLLKKYYEDPVDPLLVRYRDFIGDVDEGENVAAQLALRQSVRKLPTTNSNNGTMLVSRGSPLTSGAGTSNNNFQGTFTANCAVADGVLKRIADFVLRRNVRLEEFCKDGDQLRKGFLSNSRFRHAMDILGMSLSEAEMVALEQAFASPKAPDSVNYVDFLAAVRDTKAEAQIHSMTAGGSARAEAIAKRTEVEDKLLERIIVKVQRGFGSRRIASRQVFQDYDKLHKGRVPEGHFFTALLSVGLNLTPTENAALKKAYSNGDGSMLYGEFSAKVDEQLGLDK